MGTFEFNDGTCDGVDGVGGNNHVIVASHQYLSKHLAVFNVSDGFDGGCRMEVALSLGVNADEGIASRNG